MTLLTVAHALRDAVDRFEFKPPVAYVYNPLRYAEAPYAEYLQRYGVAPKEAVLLGMNPGPFGMAQTGIPFGDVAMVRGWIGIEAPVGKPPREHPARPVQGFACPRSEVSGTRLWGWAKQRFGTPEAFFSRFFVLNYCPVAFMAASAKNLTPDKLPRDERQPLLAACDEALRQSIALLAPRWAIGVGAFATERLHHACVGLDLQIGQILHPSPLNPQANRGWAPIIERQLGELGVAL